MGSCASVHKTSGSALKLEMTTSSFQPDDHKHSIPSTPSKDNSRPPIVDAQILSLGYKSRVSPWNSVASYRSYGSKEETFFDTQAWLDSDCDDDFYSVNGDFTPSCGSTPVHNGVGNARINRTFSPQVNRALFDGRPPLHNASNGSRSSVSLHQRSSSAASPRVSVSSPARPSTSNQDAPSKTKKKLADLFRESFRERPDETLTLAGYENTSILNASPLPPKPANGTPLASGTNSLASSGKRTPTGNSVLDKGKTLKVAQCCFPRLIPSRSFRENKKASSPSIAKDDIKA